MDITDKAARTLRCIAARIDRKTPCESKPNEGMEPCEHQALCEEITELVLGKLLRHYHKGMA